MSDLIKLVSIIVIAAASAGRLPCMIRSVHNARVHLIQETKASKWGMPYLLKDEK